jgi:hypothetical protein
LDKNLESCIFEAHFPQQIEINALSQQLVFLLLVDWVVHMKGLRICNLFGQLRFASLSALLMSWTLMAAAPFQSMDWLLSAAPPEFCFLFNLPRNFQTLPPI